MDNVLCILIFKAYGNMLRMQGDAQVKYANRLHMLVGRMRKSRPDGEPLWNVLQQGAFAAYRGDQVELLKVSMVVNMLASEIKAMLKGA